jgi:3-methyladenine DNA glycosylase AlkD
MVRKKSAPAKVSTKAARSSLHGDVQAAVEWLKQNGTQRDRDNLARFAITAPKSFGVSMARMRVLAKRLGRNHDLAAALWDTGWYEARMLATLVDEPERVTAAQMDRWCRDFDNWAICDTACFALFDRTPHAWRKIEPWSERRGEFQKRAAFALLASIALHDKEAADAPFLASLVVIERAADDDRNFVKKGVNWALRAVGRRNPVLNAAAVTVARRLAASAQSAPRWIGKDALREFAKHAARRKSPSRRKRANS